MKVLIADDTNTDRLLLKLHLSKLGHHIIEASNGIEAIEQYILHENDIDLRFNYPIKIYNTSVFELCMKVRFYMTMYSGNY